MNKSKSRNLNGSEYKNISQYFFSTQRKEKSKAINVK